MTLSETQSRLCDSNPHDFSDLRAVVFNTSLKKDEGMSHTRLLLSVASEIMARNGVDVERIHAASHQIAYGVYPDMTEHGWGLCHVNGGAREACRTGLYADLAPSGECLRPEIAKAAAGDQVALDIKVVVDGGMGGKEPLRRAR